MEDSDSILYTITVLKGMYEAGYYEGEEFVHGTKTDLLGAFAKTLREKRYMVREDFTFDPTQQGKAAMALEQLQVEVDNMRSGLTRWCKTHYGEAFVAWMHIKVIRVFVDSDWVGCRKTRKSTCGGAMYFGDMVAKCCSTTQGVIA